MRRNEKPGSGDAIQRLIPPVTLWLTGMILKRPPVQAKLKKADRALYGKKAEAAKAVKRTTARPGWLAAGTAALAVSAACFGMAGRNKKATGK